MIIVQYECALKEKIRSVSEGSEVKRKEQKSVVKVSRKSLRGTPSARYEGRHQVCHPVSPCYIFFFSPLCHCARVTFLDFPGKRSLLSGLSLVTFVGGGRCTQACSTPPVDIIPAIFLPLSFIHCDRIENMQNPQGWYNNPSWKIIKLLLLTTVPLEGSKGYSNILSCALRPPNHT